jgi:hypothetical protein
MRKPIISLVAGVVGALAFASAAAALTIIIVIDIDLTPASAPPKITITAPANGSTLTGSQWATACSPAGICGTATDKNGVASVQVAVRRNATGLYWNGSAFASAAAAYQAAALSGTSWRFPLALPPDGQYTAFVRATDGLGNTTPAGSPAQSTFTVNAGIPPGASFGITATIPTSLWPGTSQRVDLKLSNPLAYDLRVDRVDLAVTGATLDGSPNPACGTANFTTTSFFGPLNLAANTTKTLSQLGVPQSQWPTLSMLETNANQNACQRSVVVLAYTGTGEV